MVPRLQQLMNICVIVIILHIIPNSAFSAEVNIARDAWGEPFVSIIGGVVKGDLKKIKDISAQLILNLDEHGNKTLHFHLDTR